MTQLDDVVVPLLSARIFSGLSPAHLKALALEAEAVTFKRGDVLIRTYQEGDGAYLIGSGSVVEHHEADEGEPQQEFGAGAMIGEMAMLIETLHSSTIVARTPVQALKFKRATLQALIEKDPSLAEHFVSRMCTRLTDTAKKLRAVDAMFAGAGRADVPVPRLS
jgi:CRP-like cAMP-binding protein